MSNLQQKERPIDEAIVKELIDLTPEWWRAAALDVVYSKEDDIEKYTHAISSLEGHKEPVLPSDELFTATRELGLLFRDHGKQWKRARYEIHLQDDGSWRYSVDFDY